LPNISFNGVYEMKEEKYEAVCAHEPCGCPVSEFGAFCSDWCEKAMVSTDCGCAHDECRAIAVAID
jgi:hypothetical protein